MFVCFVKVFKILFFVSEYINIRNKEGLIVFYVVCMRGNVNVVEFFLCYGVDYDLYNWLENMFLFYYVVKCGFVELVEFFILYGVVVDVRDRNIRILLYR